MGATNIVFFVLVVCFSAVGVVAVTDVSIGNAVVTQDAFNDGPDRYAAFIQEALTRLEQYPLPNVYNTGGCRPQYIIYGSSSTRSYQLTSSPTISILSDRVRVVANVAVSIYVTVWFQVKKRFIFCFSDTICNYVRAHVTSTGTITTDFVGTNGPMGYNLVAQTNVAFASFNIAGCDFGGFLAWAGDVRNKLTQACIAAVQEGATTISNKFNLPTAFSPYPNTTIVYKIQSMQFSQDQWVYMRFLASLYVRKNDANGLPVVYQWNDPDATGANMFPPSGFTFNRDANTTATGAPPHKQLLLTGIRVNSNIVPALFWAGRTLEAYSYAINVTILDAELQGALYWETPGFRVTGRNQFYFNVSEGGIILLCGNAGAVDRRPIIDFSFNGFQGGGRLEMAEADNRVGVLMQIEYLNADDIVVKLEAPRIPLPKQQLDNAIRTALEKATPVVNEWLETHPMILSDDASWLLPHATGSVETQGIPHGYINFETWCDCANADPRWPACFLSPCPRSVPGYGQPLATTPSVLSSPGVEEPVFSELSSSSAASAGTSLDAIFASSPSAPSASASASEQPRSLLRFSRASYEPSASSASLDLPARDPYVDEREWEAHRRHAVWLRDESDHAGASRNEDLETVAVNDELFAYVEKLQQLQELSPGDAKLERILQMAGNVPSADLVRELTEMVAQYKLDTQTTGSLAAPMCPHRIIDFVDRAQPEGTGATRLGCRATQTELREWEDRERSIASMVQQHAEFVELQRSRAEAQAKQSPTNWLGELILSQMSQSTSLFQPIPADVAEQIGVEPKPTAASPSSPSPASEPEEPQEPVNLVTSLRRLLSHLPQAKVTSDPTSPGVLERIRSYLAQDEKDASIETLAFTPKKVAVPTASSPWSRLYKSMSSIASSAVDTAAEAASSAASAVTAAVGRSAAPAPADFEASFETEVNPPGIVYGLYTTAYTAMEVDNSYCALSKPTQMAQVILFPDTESTCRPMNMAGHDGEYYQSSFDVDGNVLSFFYGCQLNTSFAAPYQCVACILQANPQGALVFPPGQMPSSAGAISTRVLNSYYMLDGCISMGDGTSLVFSLHPKACAGPIDGFTQSTNPNQWLYMHYDNAQAPYVAVSALPANAPCPLWPVRQSYLTASATPITQAKIYSIDGAHTDGQCQPCNYGTDFPVAFCRVTQSTPTSYTFSAYCIDPDCAMCDVVVSSPLAIDTCVQPGNNATMDLLMTTSLGYCFTPIDHSDGAPAMEGWKVFLIVFFTLFGVAWVVGCAYGIMTGRLSFDRLIGNLRECISQITCRCIWTTLHDDLFVEYMCCATCCYGYLPPKEKGDQMSDIHQRTSGCCNINAWMPCLVTWRPCWERRPGSVDFDKFYTFKELRTLKRIELASSFMFFLSMIMWAAQNPLRFISDTDTLSDLGLPLRYLDTSGLTDNFNAWWHWSISVCLIMSIYMFIVAHLCHWWKTYQFETLAATTVLHIHKFSVLIAAATCIGLYLIPPFLIIFKECILITSGHNNFVSDNPDMNENANMVVGYSFSGIVFSYIANLYLVAVTSFAPASFLAAVLTLYNLDRKHQQTLRASLASEEESVQRAQAQIHDNDVFVFMSPPRLSRLRTIVLLVHVMTPISAIVPVIIIYQSLNVGSVWAALWGMVWICPFIFIQILDRRLDTLRKGTYYWKAVRKELVANAAVYLILHWILVIVILVIEHDYVKFDLTFVFVLYVTGFWTACVAFFVLIFGQPMDPEPDENKDKQGTDANTTLTDGANGTSSAPSSPRAAKHAHFATDGRQTSPEDFEREKAARREEMERQETARLRASYVPHSAFTEVLRWICAPCLLSLMLAGACMSQGWHRTVDGFNETMGKAYRKYPSLMHYVNLTWGWLFEKHEDEMRLPLRRFCLVIGVVFSSYLFSLTVREVQITGKEFFTEMFAQLGFNMQWPDEENGGTIFDDAFAVFDKWKWVAFALNGLGFLCVALALISDVIFGSLPASRFFSFFSLPLIFLGMNAVAMPNYLGATRLDTVVPSCAPEFDKFVRMFAGALIGVVCSALLVMKLVVVMLTVSPSVLRVCMLTMEDLDRSVPRAHLVITPRHHFKLSANYPEQWAEDTEATIIWRVDLLDSTEKREVLTTYAEMRRDTSSSFNETSFHIPARLLQAHTLYRITCIMRPRMQGPDVIKSFDIACVRCIPPPRQDIRETQQSLVNIMAFSALLSPVIAALPLMMMFQAVARHGTSFFVLMFWIIPLCIALRINSRNFLRYYIMYILSYLVTLLSLLLYVLTVTKIGTSVIVSQLSNAQMYMELTTEVFLANVVLGDLLYVNLFKYSSRPKAPTKPPGAGDKPKQGSAKAPPPKASHSTDGETGSSGSGSEHGKRRHRHKSSMSDIRGPDFVGAPPTASSSATYKAGYYARSWLHQFCNFCDCFHGRGQAYLSDGTPLPKTGLILFDGESKGRQLQALARQGPVAWGKWNGRIVPPPPPRPSENGVNEPAHPVALYTRQPLIQPVYTKEQREADFIKAQHRANRMKKHQQRHPDDYPEYSQSYAASINSQTVMSNSQSDGGVGNGEGQPNRNYDPYYAGHRDNGQFYNHFERYNNWDNEYGNGFDDARGYAQYGGEYSVEYSQSRSMSSQQPGAGAPQRAYHDADETSNATYASNGSGNVNHHPPTRQQSKKTIELTTYGGNGSEQNGEYDRLPSPKHTSSPGARQAGGGVSLKRTQSKPKLLSPHSPMKSVSATTSLSVSGMPVNESVGSVGVSFVDSSTNYSEDDIRRMVENAVQATTGSPEDGEQPPPAYGSAGATSLKRNASQKNLSAYPPKPSVGLGLQLSHPNNSYGYEGEGEPPTPTREPPTPTREPPTPTSLKRNASSSKFTMPHANADDEKSYNGGAVHPPKPSAKKASRAAAPHMPGARRPKKCQECTTNNATCSCGDCSELFCDDCANMIHKHGNRAKHILLPL